MGKAKKRRETCVFYIRTIKQVKYYYLFGCRCTALTRVFRLLVNHRWIVLLFHVYTQPNNFYIWQLFWNTKTVIFPARKKKHRLGNIESFKLVYLKCDFATRTNLFIHFHCSLRKIVIKCNIWMHWMANCYEVNAEMDNFYSHEHKKKKCIWILLQHQFSGEILTLCYFVTFFVAFKFFCFLSNSYRMFFKKNSQNSRRSTYLSVKFSTFIAFLCVE